MIKYHRGIGVYYLRKLFQWRGSVFPYAIQVTLPCAIITGILEHLSQQGMIGFIEATPQGDGDSSDRIMGESAVWSGFTFLVGFATVFRTSIAYARFWDGASATNKMRAEWFDAASAICAFCKHSNQPRDQILKFQHLLIRLFSLLHALALADIEDCGGHEIQDIEAFKRELIDIDGLDHGSLLAVKNAEMKVQLAFQWIQQFVVENIHTKVLDIPPPILSRVFQEMANGMVQYHEALKVSSIPFPFPYAQTCDALLVCHWLLTPIINAQWVNSVVWSMIFTFVQVFILWSLNTIAIEIENPFGRDPNDLDQEDMQQEMNNSLLLLIRPETIQTPTLSSRALMDARACGDSISDGRPSMGSRTNSTIDRMRRGSMIKAWDDIEAAQETGPRVNGKGRGSRTSFFSIASGLRFSSVIPEDVAEESGGQNGQNDPGVMKTSSVSSSTSQPGSPSKGNRNLRPLVGPLAAMQEQSSKKSSGSDSDSSEDDSDSEDSPPETPGPASRSSSQPPAQATVGSGASAQATSLTLKNISKETPSSPGGPVQGRDCGQSQQQQLEMLEQHLRQLLPKPRQPSVDPAVAEERQPPTLREEEGEAADQAVDVEEDEEQHAPQQTRKEGGELKAPDQKGCLLLIESVSEEGEEQMLRSEDFPPSEKPDSLWRKDEKPPEPPPTPTTATPTPQVSPQGPLESSPASELKAVAARPRKASKEKRGRQPSNEDEPTPPASPPESSPPPPSLQQQSPQQQQQQVGMKTLPKKPVLLPLQDPPRLDQDAASAISASPRNSRSPKAKHPPKEDRWSLHSTSPPSQTQVDAERPQPLPPEPHVKQPPGDGAITCSKVPPARTDSSSAGGASETLARTDSSAAGGASETLSPGRPPGDDAQ